MASNFTCRCLNRFDQFWHTSIELIITHDEGTIPAQRIGKDYVVPGGNYDALDINFFGAEAEAEVDRIVEEWNASQAAP